MKISSFILFVVLSITVFAQKPADTVIYTPFFCGLKYYGHIPRLEKVVDEQNNIQQRLINEWCKQNMHIVYNEFIRLINDARKVNTVERFVTIITDELDRQHLISSDDSLVVVKNSLQAKKVIREFIKLHPKATYREITGFFSKKPLFEITYTKKVNDILFDSITSIASAHHNRYLILESNFLTKDWQTANRREYWTGHSEISNNYKYHDTIISHFTDRVDYFSNGERIGCSEIFYWYSYFNYFKFDYETKIDKKTGTTYGVPTKIKNDPALEIAKQIFEGFKESKPHWKIIMSKTNYEFIGMNLMMDGDYAAWITVNFSVDKK